MLYFQLVIMAGTVMLAYYFEYTDTFNVHVQGFFCHDGSYTKPYPGPDEISAIPPALLYSLVAGVPPVMMIVGEVAVFFLQSATKEFGNREKTIITGDCCYINPLVRRTVRFLGVYAFGLFATDIFVNAGQVVTGNLAPHFLTVCKPNYTALGCQHETVQFINSEEACTGNIDDITKARKSFPSKEAALSVYAAVYLAMYITCTVKTNGTRLAKPLLCLGLMCLAFLTGINRVAEYRNHWSDVVAGFIIGTAVGVFLVACVVHNFKGRHTVNEKLQPDNVTDIPLITLPHVESPFGKLSAVQLYHLPDQPQLLATAPSTASSKPATATTSKDKGSRCMGTPPFHIPLQATHHPDLELYHRSFAVTGSKSWNLLPNSTVGYRHHMDYRSSRRWHHLLKGN